MIRRFTRHNFNRWRAQVSPARAAALRPQYPRGASGTALKAPSGEVSASPSRASGSAPQQRPSAVPETSGTAAATPYRPRKPKIDPRTIPSSMEMRAASWRRPK